MHPGRHLALDPSTQGLELRGYPCWMGKDVNSGVTVAFGESGRSEQGEVVT